jgi:hypothetical protein
MDQNMTSSVAGGGHWLFCSPAVEGAGDAAGCNGIDVDPVDGIMNPADDVIMDLDSLLGSPQPELADVTPDTTIADPTHSNCCGQQDQPWAPLATETAAAAAAAAAAGRGGEGGAAGTGSLCAALAGQADSAVITSQAVPLQAAAAWLATAPAEELQMALLESSAPLLLPAGAVSALPASSGAASAAAWAAGDVHACIAVAAAAASDVCHLGSSCPPWLPDGEAAADLQPQVMTQTCHTRCTAAAAAAEWDPRAVNHPPGSLMLLGDVSGQTCSTPGARSRINTGSSSRSSQLIPLVRQARLLSCLSTKAAHFRYELLGVCAGKYGDSSALALEGILGQVQAHNAAAAAAVQGCAVVDVLHLKEHWFLQRHLLHLLVSNVRVFGPNQELLLVPDSQAGSSSSSSSGTSSRMSMSATARLQLLHGFKAFADSSSSSSSSSSASGVAHPGSSCWCVNHWGGCPAPAVSSLVGEVACADDSCSNGVRFSSSSGSCRSSGSTFGQLLHIRNLNQASVWLTACHFCIPEVMDFLLALPDLSFEHMTAMTAKGEGHSAARGAERITSGI